MSDKNFQHPLSILVGWFVAGVVLGALVFAVAYIQLTIPV